MPNNEMPSFMERLRMSYSAAPQQVKDMGYAMLDVLSLHPDLLGVMIVGIREHESPFVLTVPSPVHDEKIMEGFVQFAAVAAPSLTFAVSATKTAMQSAFDAPDDDDDDSPPQ